MKRHSATLATFVAAFLLPLAVPAADAPTHAEAPAKVKQVEKQCKPTAASRVRKNKADGCASDAQSTRTYSKQDLESTGQTDTAEALRRLDPRLQ